MTLIPTSELEAVNLMLATIGESPVSTLAQSGQVDAVIAHQTLSETSIDVQSRGWRFNTDKAYPLKREAAAPWTIPVPATAVRIDTVGADATLDLTVRGGKLWDRRNHSFSFPERAEIRADVVWLLPFDELPQAARRFIAVKAARIFQDRVVGSSTINRFTRRDEEMAEAGLRKFEAKTAKRSVLNSNWAVMRVLNRRA
ncbi:MAG: hypothetical protein AAF869_08215 [Pseudomonadota bacterium]